MQKWKQPLRFAVLFSLLLLVVGCSQEVDLTLWEGNQFSATILNAFPVDENNPAEEVAQELDAEVSNIRNQPNITSAVWERIETNEDEFRAEIKIEGNSYDAIESLLEGGASIETEVVNGREAVSFTYDYSPTLAYTLTLNSGEVISSNGTAVDADTTQWNGGLMTAVVTPKSRAADNTLLIGGAVLLVILLAVLAMFFVRRSPRQA